MHTSMTRLSQALFAILLLVTPVSALAQLQAQVVDSGFQQPVAVVADPHQPPGSEALIVVEQRGSVHAIVNGVRRPTLVLDLTADVKFLTEQGMLGFAFHPTDPTRVFVAFSRRRTPDDGMSDTVIARFTRSADPFVLDPASRKDLVFPGNPPTPFIPQPSAVHKGGDLHFRLDGAKHYLYVGLGDGGSASLPPTEGNAQHPGSLLGKFLRLDVDVEDSHPTGYVVPADNPFIPYQQPPYGVLGEIWSFGFRNPWRWSFDDFGEGATGAMIIGDVGEFDREEIDYEPVGAGLRNYGWPVREGSIPTPGRTPRPPAFEPLTPPIADYPRTIGRSVTGGFVYRGTALPARYRGRYFVADYFGKVFSLGLATTPGGAQVTDVLDHSAELGSPRLISTFGRGNDGELYFTSFIGGRVMKIVTSPPEPPSAPQNPVSEVSGSTVRISWQNGPTGGSPTSFVLEAGSGSGLANLLVTGAASSPLVVNGVPNGLYFVRVRAVNDLGTSAPSDELQVQVGCTAPPTAPAAPTVQISGRTVSLQWAAATGATGYLLEAGSAPGLSNLASIPTSTPSLAGDVLPNVYHVRVHAINPCGTSAPSEEIVVTVP